MKNPVFVLLGFLFIGISFMASTGVAKEDLFRINPVLENIPNPLYSVSRNTIVPAQPDSAQPDSAQPDSAQPDSAQPDSAQPDSAQPDSAQPDSARPDSTQPDSILTGINQNNATPIAAAENKPETDTNKDDETKGDETKDEEDFDLDIFDEYDDEVEDVQMVADPLYHFNYAMYLFNDFLYFHALKPVVQGYKFIAPTPLRNGINNVSYNLLFPVRFVNNIFQGKLLAASDEIGIFLANSTLGILGFNQFAQKHLNMKTFDEDLGQTLGYYAVGDGFYLVLPILGPSTIRDALGRVGDYFITPINYVEPWELDLGLSITDKVNRTSFRIGDYEALKDASLDPYVAIRNAYIQNRRSEIEK